MGIIATMHTMHSMDGKSIVCKTLVLCAYSLLTCWAQTQGPWSIYLRMRGLDTGNANDDCTFHVLKLTLIMTCLGSYLFTLVHCVAPLEDMVADADRFPSVFRYNDAAEIAMIGTPRSAHGELDCPAEDVADVVVVAGDIEVIVGVDAVTHVKQALMEHGAPGDC
ncbi:hypothetical protein BX616_002558 [Lobosporangium transversale]|nr:hypothetical protein BX616_002558 [Lobosporangium transversale]